jgi:hypothetical protein
MVLGVVVVPAGEAMARLLDWQGLESGLLDEWWAARRDHDDALAMRDRLVIGRDRAVSRLVGGMTTKQRKWVESHLSYAARPRDVAGRRLVLTWLQRRRDVETCEAEWNARIDRSEVRLRVAESRLYGLAGPVMAMWGSKLSTEMTGVSWQRLKTWARVSLPIPVTR